MTVGYKPFLIVFMYPIILTKLYTMITLSFTVTPVDTKYPPFTDTITDEMEVIENFMYLIKHDESWVISDLVLYYNKELA